jgi:hypothetical protein
MRPSRLIWTKPPSQYDSLSERTLENPWQQIHNSLACFVFWLVRGNRTFWSNYQLREAVFWSARKLFTYTAVSWPTTKWENDNHVRLGCGSVPIGRLENIQNPETLVNIFLCLTGGFGGFECWLLYLFDPILLYVCELLNIHLVTASKQYVTL